MRLHPLLACLALGLCGLPSARGASGDDEWRSDQPSRVEANGDSFRLTSPSASDLTQVILPERRLESGRLEADVRFVSVLNDERWIALLGRVDAEDPEPYLQFIVRRDATGKSGLEIARRLNDDWQIIVRGRAESAPSLGTWFHMALEVDGQHARGYLDGELVVETWWHGGAPGLGVPGFQVSGGVAEVRAIEANARPKQKLASTSAEVTWVAHRGLSREAPENTLASLSAAIEAGIPAAEFDVRSTIDGELVLFHDDKLARTTRGQALDPRRPVPQPLPEYLAATTIAQLRQLDAGSWMHERFAGEKVPTLREALTLCRGRLLAVVEIKDVTIGFEVARQIAELGMTGEAIVISFHEQALRDVRSTVPEIPTALLDGDVPSVVTTEHIDALIGRARRIGANALDLSYRWITPELVRRVRRRGLGLYVYTVNDPELADWLIGLGVTGITSDRRPR